MKFNPFSLARIRRSKVIVFLVCSALLADEPDTISDTSSVDALFAMSLEDLITLPVAVATRTSQPIKEVPAAVTVITGEDIRRSGSVSIPEALRMAPGIEASQLNNNSWAVGIRGYNGYAANKMLVMMDGRSVYAPLFAGTYWDSADTVMDDIDRIEIIRGPGSAVWGANTMNGVVNILTKSAKDTQGTFVKAGVGTELQGLVAARHGVRVGENAYLRVFGKYHTLDDSILPDNQDATDSLQAARGGFRLDLEPSPVTQLTFQGDIYGINEHNQYILKPIGSMTSMPMVDDMVIRGGNFMGKMVHELESDVTMSFQAYYDRAERKKLMIHDLQNIADFEFTLSGPKDNRHQWSGGLGYRSTFDHVCNHYVDTLTYSPESRTIHLYSAFVQDTIAITPDKLALTLGSKVEHNSYTGFEIQPGVRLQYTINSNHMLWGSVTRAVRTPSRTDQNAVYNPGGPIPILFVSNPSMKSETLMAYEMGYRGNWGSRWSLDLAFFFNDYNRLASRGAPNLTPSGLITEIGNGADGKAQGVEINPKVQLTDWWRMMAAYTYQYDHFDHEPLPPPDAPKHILNLQSRMDLSETVEFDVIGRYVGRRALTSFSGAPIEVSSWWTMDVRLGWRPRPNLELALIGKNLLSPSHPEFKEVYVPIQSTEIQRSFVGTVKWSF